MNLFLICFSFTEWPGLRACYRKKLGRYVYGCQMHINKRKHWAGQWDTPEEARRAYDWFAVHEYGNKKKDEELNYPQDRHRVDQFMPAGIRQVNKEMEIEHRLAEAQIASRNVLPHNDPYVRHLLQTEPDLMSFQQFGAGPSQGAGSSQGAGPSYDNLNSIGIWDSDEEDEEDQQQQRQQQQEQWEKHWDSDSEQRRQERQPHQTWKDDEEEQHQLWQESEQRLLPLYGPPNPNKYRQSDPRHWVEVNRQDDKPPFCTASGQPWGIKGTDDTDDPMFWVGLDSDEDDEP